MYYYLEILIIHNKQQTLYYPQPSQTIYYIFGQFLRLVTSPIPLFNIYPMHLFLQSNMITTTLILLLIHLVQGHSVTMDQHSINIDTGTTTLIGFTFSGTTLLYQYQITYSQPFLTNPKAITNLKGIQNCYAQQSQYFVINRAVKSVSTTAIKLEFSNFIGQGFDSYLYINIYYLISQVKNTYISIGTVGVNTFSIPNYTVTFPNGLSDKRKEEFPEPSVYLNCFLNGIYCREGNQYGFKLINSCSKAGNSTIAYTTSTVGGFPISSCNRYDIHFSYLIIFSRNTMFSYAHGTFTVTPDTSPALTIPVLPRSVFIIGLASLETADGCLHFTLTSTNRFVDVLSDFLKLDFNYVLINYSIPNPDMGVLTTQIYPLTDKVIFTVYQLDFYQISFPITFSSTLTLSSVSNGAVFCNITSPITDAEITWDFKTIGSIDNYQVNIKGTLITSNLVKINTNNQTMDIYLSNTSENSTVNNITSNFTGTLRQVINLNSTTTIVRFSFNQSSIGQQFNFQYRSFAHNFNKTVVYLPFATIPQIQISMKDRRVVATINGLPQLDVAVLSQFLLLSSWMSNPSIVKQSSQVMQLGFEEDSGMVERSSRFIKFRTATASKYEVEFQFKTIGVENTTVTPSSKEYRMRLVNLRDGVLVSEFQVLSSNGIRIVSLQIDSDDSTSGFLNLDYSNHNTQNQFSLQYIPSGSAITSLINHITIQERFLNMYINDLNLLVINLNNLQNLSTSAHMSFLEPILQVVNISLQGNTIEIQAINDQSLNGTFIDIVFDLNASTYYKEVVHLQVLTLACKGQYPKQQDQYFYACFVVVLMYWILFIVGIVCSQKIYVVETVFALQFTYMSYIPINNYCSPLTSLEQLKYSFGWNGIVFDVPSIPLTSFYSYLGFQSNIVLNINIMLLPIFVFPLISLLFLVLAKRSQGYRAKPRLTALFKNLLLDLPFTFTLINIPNIVTSVVISFQTFGTSNTLSLIMCCVLCSLVLIEIVVFLIFQRHFFSYHQQFNSTKQICGISIQKSTKIRQLYPILIVLEITVISAILSLQSLLKISLYLSLGFLVLFTAIKMLMCPYNNSIDNARLFTYQFFLILINSLQIGFKFLQTSNSSITTINLFPWSILIILIIILTGITLPYLTYRIILWLRRKSSIDIHLYNKCNPSKRHVFKRDPLSSPVFYPARQFSIYKKKMDEMGNVRQELLNVEKINGSAREEKKVGEQMNWEGVNQ